MAELKPGLWSVGYEGREINSFVALLDEARIQTVADVRLTPLSRKPGFSKNALRQALRESGIDYRHFRSLGNPKSNRPPFQEGRAADGRAAFRRLLDTEEGGQDLDELAGLARRSRVAVLCFERDEARCHRYVVLRALEERMPVSVISLP
jgi:uncharacterized protein (DUF488 family)